MEQNKVFAKEITFSNFYTNENDSIKLFFTVEDGFDSIEEAVNTVRSMNQDSSAMRFACFRRQVYAIGIDGPYKEIVIAKEFMWIRHQYSLLKQERKPLKESVVKKNSAHGVWNHRLAEDMFNATETNAFYLTTETGKNCNGYQYALNFQTLLAIAFCDTIVSVFKLGAFDKYFMMDYQPSRKKYWAEGVVAINPYESGSVVYSENRDLYTRKQWTEQKNDAHIAIFNKGTTKQNAIDNGIKVDVFEPIGYQAWQERRELVRQATTKW